MAQSCKKQATLHKYFGGGPSMAPQPPAKKTCPYSGIKLYSEEEIKESGEGLDKTFKQFWNKRIKEITTDESCKKLLPSKAAIKGAVYTDWTLEKTSLLEVEADEIKMKASKLHIYRKKRAEDAKIVNMTKNVSDMKNKHDTLVALFERGELEDGMIEDNEIDIALKDLKKAQDALKKSITRRKLEIKQLQSTDSETNDVTLVNDDEIALTDSEINTVVAVIKAQDDICNSDSDNSENIDIC